MATLQPDPNIVAKAIARLTDLYRTKPNVRALVETLAERFAAEDAVECELYRTQWISTATGPLLTAIGELVGEPRLGRADDLYRVWIQARVRINRTQGTIPDSYHLIRLVAGKDAQIIYTPEYPAAYVLEVNGGTPVDPNEMYKLLDAVRPAGVGMSLIYTPYEDPATLFTLADADVLITDDPDKGLADPAQTIGGKFRKVL